MGSESEPDSIMPVMVRKLASPILSGLLLAAPCAAIMSTVAAFLFLVSSTVVRDLYQRTHNPGASKKSIRILTYSTTGGLGFLVAALAIFPPDFLQYVIVFTITAQASAFLFPIIFALFWHRANLQGKLADMLVRFSVLVGLYILGWTDTATKASPAVIFGAQLQSLFGWLPGWGKPRPSKLAPLIVWGMEPLVWGFASSLCAAVGVALAFPLRKETNEV